MEFLLEVLLEEQVCLAIFVTDGYAFLFIAVSKDVCHPLGVRIT
jgi:hypothetical protein